MVYMNTWVSSGQQAWKICLLWQNDRAYMDFGCKSAVMGQNERAVTVHESTSQIHGPMNSWDMYEFMAHECQRP